MRIIARGRTGTRASCQNKLVRLTNQPDAASEWRTRSPSRSEELCCALGLPPSAKNSAAASGALGLTPPAWLRLWAHSVSLLQPGCGFGHLVSLLQRLRLRAHSVSDTLRAHSVSLLQPRTRLRLRAHSVSLLQPRTWLRLRAHSVSLLQPKNSAAAYGALVSLLLPRTLSWLTKGSSSARKVPRSVPRRQ